MRQTYIKPDLMVYVHAHVQCICGSATGGTDSGSISNEGSEDLVKSERSFSSDDNFWE